jgi:hypothetical protein
MKRKYRIVNDAYNGFEVQHSYWFAPFMWFQTNGINTFSSLEKAENFARSRGVVKSLGYLD